ncbi:hypothetical protein [Actinoallomurus sp. NPDC050550]|uniref:hypothetical protein n=1 Tax=Actinoallomurus sp. NPDC050550 TaxID=3154937 RepID=UPI00340837F1
MTRYAGRQPDREVGPGRLSARTADGPYAQLVVPVRYIDVIHSGDDPVAGMPREMRGPAGRSLGAPR